MPGRPRSDTADAAILSAAIEIFGQVGFDALTVEAVAAQAGVGRATVYRRYPSKGDLIVSAVRTIEDAEVPDPDTGSVVQDVLALVRAFARLLDETPMGAVIVQIMAMANRDPQWRSALQGFVATGRERGAAVLARGIRRGELRHDTDIELVVDLLVAPLFYRSFLGTQRSVDDAPTVVAAILLPWQSALPATHSRVEEVYSWSSP